MAYIFFLSFLAIIMLTVGESYCRSGPTTAMNSNLGPTRLVGDSKYIQDTYACPGFIGPQDLTFLEADLSVDLAYTLTVNVITCGIVFPTLAGAWIDYDRNFAFETWEQLGSFTTAQNTTNIFFTVPDSTLVEPGPTRLRVQVQETQADNMNPCSSFAYGATKDFTVIIATKDDPSEPRLPRGALWAIVVGVGLLFCCCVYKFCHKAKEDTSRNYTALTASTYSYTAPVTPSSCYQCHGSRVVILNCVDCEGVGYVQATGSFQARKGLGRMECPSCGGRGHITSPCPACVG